MRIVAAMIVGPGEGVRYLDRTLRLASVWADEIVACCDRCDQDTLDAVRARTPHLCLVGEKGFHESTVRNSLFAMLDDTIDDGDIVVILDADEELRRLDGGPPRQVLKSFVSDHGADAWAVKFWHLWSPDGTVHRVDGAWQPSVGCRIYRHRKAGRVPEREIASAAIPSPPNDFAPPQLGIAHWGYARPHDRQAKHEHYMAVDGGRFHLLSHLESIITEATETTLEPVPCS